MKRYKFQRRPVQPLFDTRLNIRPFVTAGVLRAKVNVLWNKDRGTDPEPNASGTTDRLNDLHFTNQQKRDARAARSAT